MHWNSRHFTPINTNAFAPFHSSQIKVTQQQVFVIVESERKNIERKYSFSYKVSPSVSILLYSREGVIVLSLYLERGLVISST
jgi:hypothetical protein